MQGAVNSYIIATGSDLCLAMAKEDMGFRQEEKWELIWEGDAEPSLNWECMLVEPKVLRAGTACGFYVHSSLGNDRGILYQSCYSSACGEDEDLKITPGSARIGVSPFGQHGWTRPNRYVVEFFSLQPPAQPADKTAPSLAPFFTVFALDFMIQGLMLIIPLLFERQSLPCFFAIIGRNALYLGSHLKSLSPIFLRDYGGVIGPENPLVLAVRKKDVHVFHCGGGVYSHRGTSWWETNRQHFFLFYLLPKPIKQEE